MGDNKEDLICPACGQGMKKYFIENANIYIDVCTDGCGGIYFDNRELEKILKTNLKHEQDLYQEISNKKFHNIDTTKKRICPVCGKIMMKNGAANGDVKIDVCASCGGKFLDKTELQSIINSKDNEDTDNKLQAVVETMYEINLENTETCIKAIPGHTKRVEFFQNLAKEYIMNRGNDER